MTSRNKPSPVLSHKKNMIKSLRTMLFGGEQRSNAAVTLGTRMDQVL